jgi:hypothetical protein
MNGVGLFFKVLAVGMFGAYIFADNNTNLIDFEKTVLLLFGTLLCAFMMIRGKMEGQYNVLNNACAVAVFFVTGIYFIRNHRGLCIKKWFQGNAVVLLIILVFVLLSIEVIDSWLMWDAAIYYSHPFSLNDLQGVFYNFDAQFGGVNDLYLAGHASLGYSLWLILFQLFNEGNESVQVSNIILAGISIFAYYQVLKKMLDGKYSNKMISLATIPYAFSPFVLGMIGSLNLDSATMYFFIIFIACSLYKFEVLEWVMAFFLCFTKETAIMYYAFYILAKVICEYFKDNSFRILELIKFGFGNIKNYIYALPILLWMILKSSMPIWGGAVSWNNEGMNCFGIDESIILMKLKQIFILNFNWIFWGSLLIGGIYLVFRQVKINIKVLTLLIPIGVVGIVTIIFGCFYITWTHIRYILPIVPALYMVATVIIAQLGKDKYILWNSILSILLLIQSFYAIDPIMDSTFDSISVGNEKLYNMKVSGSQRVSSNKIFNDCIVYNRQYMYWGETLNEVLKKAGFNANMLIVLPDDANCEEWLLVGTRNGEVLWDTEKRRFEYYDEMYDVPEHCSWTKICHISDVGQTYDGNNLLYIIPRWTDIDLDFVSDKDIIRQGEIDNRGYNIQYIVMDVMDKLPLGDGNYKVSPKLDYTFGIDTNGGNGGGAFLKKDGNGITLKANNKLTYHLIFEDYQVALDVPRGNIDDAGTVQVWSTNSTSGQKWVIEEIDGYYMICFKDYALTYNLEDMSINLQPRTGNDNQLWLFSD